MLRLALPAIDYVEANTSGVPWRWSLGGGTALALQIDHRESKDIDIFVSGRPLKLFAPWANPAAKGISKDFQWPGFYLKFELPDGEIDFLSSELLTSPGVSVYEFEGRQIQIETPEEILVKKIRYRASNFQPRDTFDLACYARLSSGLAGVLADEVPDVLQRLKDRVSQLQRRGLDDLRDAIKPTAFGEAVMDMTYEIAADVVGRAEMIVGDRLGDFPSPN